MKFDSVKFIANIQSVITADGKIHPGEAAQCDEIRKHFKFSKSEWSKGEKMAAMPDFGLQPTGTFADKVQNLEMMLRVAYADGEADDNEVATIAKFCELIGISQEQLDSLNSDVAEEILSKTKSCPSCGVEVSSDAAFCPKCGSPISSSPSDGVQTEFNIPPHGISIAFAESTSSSFPTALAIAKKSPSFQECIKGKKHWYMATYATDGIEWAELIENLGGMKYCEVYENGLQKNWGDLFPWQLMTCLRNRQKAFNPILYCFGKDLDHNYPNPWGCIRANMNWKPPYDTWFRLGKWETVASVRGAHVRWRFDKEQMLFMFNKNMEGVRLCPYFNRNVGRDVLRALPDVVYPEIDEDWKFHITYDENASGTITITTRDTFGVTKEYSDGVEPAGLDFFATLLRRVHTREISLQLTV